ncbi:MAG TPA: hypothetical protein PKH99_07245 [Vicinamibacterales bacterium]|nr:hypothetical protein [Vicinamibacterales bacterium]
MSTPSSCRKLVRRTAAKEGGAAVYALRLPSSNAIQASRSAFSADAMSSGDAGLRNRWYAGTGSAGAGAAGTGRCDRTRAKQMIATWV